MTRLATPASGCTIVGAVIGGSGFAVDVLIVSLAMRAKVLEAECTIDCAG